MESELNKPHENETLWFFASAAHMKGFNIQTSSALDLYVS